MVAILSRPQCVNMTQLALLTANILLSIRLVPCLLLTFLFLSFQIFMCEETQIYTSYLMKSLKYFDCDLDDLYPNKRTYFRHLKTKAMRCRTLCISCLLLPLAVLLLLIWTVSAPSEQARKKERLDRTRQWTTTQIWKDTLRSLKSTITIQWRTKLFGEDPLVKLGGGKAPFSHCSINNCELISRTSVVIPDVLLFHIWDEPDIPKQRFAHQKYVFVTAESELMRPPYPSIRGIFNLTVTHRLDSDISIPYGRFENVNDHPKLAISTPANVAIGKSKLVAWVVSKCKTPSRRELYVAELQKYIPVDIYGKCGNLTCDRKGKCFSNIGKTYRFYLSFENSICEDYITEKLYGIMLIGGIVPVVMGGANYSKLLPPHSVINVMDFSTPRALAKYLLKLDGDDTLYNEYFQWRERFRVKRDIGLWSKNIWCRACDFLHANRNQTQIYHDMYEWYNAEKRCTDWMASKNRTSSSHAQ